MAGRGGGPCFARLRLVRRRKLKQRPSAVLASFTLNSPQVIQMDPGRRAKARSTARATVYYVPRERSQSGFQGFNSDTDLADVPPCRKASDLPQDSRVRRPPAAKALRPRPAWERKSVRLLTPAGRAQWLVLFRGEPDRYPSYAPPYRKAADGRIPQFPPGVRGQSPSKIRALGFDRNWKTDGLRRPSPSVSS